MQKHLDGSNEDEPEHAKRPRQGNRVRAGTRRERDSHDVEPEPRNRDDRYDVDDDHPQRKPARLDHTATAELDPENQAEDRCRDRAGQRPGDGARDVKDVQKRGNQGQSGDQKAAFDVEAHESEVPIGELAPQRTPEGDNHCRKPDQRQREGSDAKKVVGFCGRHNRILMGMGLTLAPKEPRALRVAKGSPAGKRSPSVCARSRPSPPSQLDYRRFASPRSRHCGTRAPGIDRVRRSR